jgi:hypothetical protein
MRRRGNLTIRRHDAKDLTLSRKETRDLYAEIDRHRAARIHVVSVEEYIVSIVPKSGNPTEKLPYLVERLPKTRRDIRCSHALAHCSNRYSLYAFNNNRVIHVSLPLDWDRAVFEKNFGIAANRPVTWHLPRLLSLLGYLGLNEGAWQLTV